MNPKPLLVIKSVRNMKSIYTNILHFTLFRKSRRENPFLNGVKASVKVVN